MNIPSLLEKLLREKSGEKAHRLFDQLAKCAAVERLAVLEAFLTYAESGPLPHCKTSAVSELRDIILPADKQYASRIASLLNVPETLYWAIDAFVTVAGKEGYGDLVAIALNTKLDAEHRAKSVRAVGIHSGQTFIVGLPSDPGEWTSKQIPVRQLRDWKRDGYKRGPGFRTPKRHVNLDSPNSDLDRIATALDAKLEVLRNEEQDPVNPTNWLIPANATDLARLRKQWPLPKHYVEFQRKYSPLNVTIEGRGFRAGLRLYGANELIQNQDGYAFRENPRRVIDCWPKEYVVIADLAADPYVLDLSKSTGDDAAVLVAKHGMGTWKFKIAYKSFLAFLSQLTK